jgi:peroxiredoxin
MNIFAQGYKPGDKAADFSLKNVIDGKMVSLKDYPNTKGIVVVFTCNHCPFSKMYESRIIDIHTKYASKGFPVVAINSNDVKMVPEDSPENMAKLAMEKKYGFPYLYDESQQVAKMFGAQRTPHVFLLKKNENDFTVEFIGAIDDNAQEASAAKDKYLEMAIEELLANKPVTNKTVKAVGCGIKWKS